MSPRLAPALPLLLAALAAAPGAARAGFPPGDRWHQNPLGFSPLELHTSRALVLAGAAAGLALVLTEASGPDERVSLYAQAGLAEAYKGPFTTVWTAEAGALWHARRWLALGGEVAWYEFRDGWNRTGGLAVRPMIRWYPLFRPSLRLFFESGAGLLWTRDAYPAPSAYDPRDGLRLNGATRYGVGAEVGLGRGWLLLAGVRHQHVSNGNVRGADRNPSHDSNGAFVGAAWTPPPRPRG